MTKSECPIDQMAQLADELTGIAVAGQEAGLRLLAAEMQALALLMPGAVHSAAPSTKTDAETEADFDNMPV